MQRIRTARPHSSTQLPLSWAQWLAWNATPFHLLASMLKTPNLLEETQETNEKTNSAPLSLITSEIAECNRAFHSLPTEALWSKEHLITFMSIIFRTHLLNHPNDRKQLVHYSQLNHLRDSVTATEAKSIVDFFKAHFIPAIKEGALDCDMNKLKLCVNKILGVLTSPFLEEEKNEFEAHLIITSDFLSTLSNWIEEHPKSKQQRRHSLPENIQTHSNATVAAPHARRSSMPSLFFAPCTPLAEETATQSGDSKHSDYHI